jgi:predicted ATPase/transcriptional regulator with XRE-family HTH domain
MEPKHSFGDWLRLKRKSLDLTREGLAQRVACSAATIRKLESEERRPSAQIVDRLAVIFQIPESEKSSFLRFARGDWRSAPPAESEASPWRTAGEPSGGAQTLAAVKPMHNLPAQANALIGRDSELAAIAARLSSPECRLLTLLGTPGIGKTRLSLQAGRNALRQFPDGVFFIALAPVSDSNLVPRAIAQTLGIPEITSQSLQESLIVSLRDQQVLLILDNFEHLQEAALGIAELLSAAQSLKVLATSREPLNLYGEVVFKVPPLALPEPEDVESLDTLSQIASVRLFIQRAQAVNDKFFLDKANAGAVAELCTRLDGLPLAIELAAARSNLFEPHSLLNRLDQRLDLLASRARDLPPRQRTLRSAIEWSYSLLSENERTLYQQLGVFAGSFDLMALQAVCDLNRALADTVLEVLGSLVDKSLLQRISMEGKNFGSSGQADEPRLMMLETLREHAREQLERSGKAEAIRQRHAQYFLALADAGPKREGITPLARRWFERVELNRLDFMAALNWLVQRGEVQLGLRLGGALWQFWVIRGYLSEGREALQSALGLAQGADLPLSDRDAMAVAMNGAGHLALYQGDYEAAQSFAEASLALWRELGDTRGTAWGLYSLGLIKAFQGHLPASRQLMLESLSTARAAGDRWCGASALEFLCVIDLEESNYPAAQAALEECLSTFRELGDVQGTAFVLRSIGYIAQIQGRFSTAWEACEESRAIFSALDHPSALGWVLERLGWLAMDQGLFELADSYIQESIHLFRKIGDEVITVQQQIMLGLLACKQGESIKAQALLQQGLEYPRSLSHMRYQAHYGLGMLSLDAGDTAAALDHFKESLSLAFAANDLRWTAGCLEAIARAAAQNSRDREAARLYGAAERLRARLGAPLPPSEREDYQNGVERAQALLDPQSFAAEWAAGQELHTEEAVALCQQAGR